MFVVLANLQSVASPVLISSIIHSINQLSRHSLRSFNQSESVNQSLSFIIEYFAHTMPGSFDSQYYAPSIMKAINRRHR